ncbi:hypothetical protein MesloDRAFT_1958 [Mesorhizobium japonicum R7A]|nr:hypothetical protein MesloDRAFT_1958 [Mesorhizobium japonicum R7A]
MTRKGLCGEAYLSITTSPPLNPTCLTMALESIGWSGVDNSRVRD